MLKIKLYFSIKKFYKNFGDELDSNFIHTISDITNDNLYDVQFDINEIADCCDDETVQWLKRLYDQISTFREIPKHEFHWDTALFTVGMVLAISFTIHQVVTAENPWADKPQVTEAPKVHTRYTAFGRYYTDGTVITDNGNAWDYSTDIVSDQVPYDNMPVWVGLDDNGTPTDITDDIILGVVFDVYTAIYDDLEVSLAEQFDLERDGNNIKIEGVK